MYCNGSMDRLCCFFVVWFEESLLVLYCCLMQIIIVEFPTFRAQSLGLSQYSGCLLFGIWDSLASLTEALITTAACHSPCIPYVMSKGVLNELHESLSGAIIITTTF